MGSELRYDGKVVVITGAGQGLGRSHALTFARRGARVVVNDLGGSWKGEGKSSAAADKVVAEIKAFGGEAVANYDSVEDGAKIVQSALDAFGRLDVVVNNAGILRDVTFAKMTQEDWDLIYRVHVLGAFRVTHAAWPHLRDQGYGRIIFTSSAAGLYGNFGQANYSAMKLAVVGMAQTLAQEGAKRNIRVNAIAPIAGSRMTETILPKELIEALKPEYVTPLVAYLSHESCEETGGIFEVGGGFMAKLRWERTEGKTFRVGRDLAPEAVEAAWPQITDFSRATHPASATESFEPVMANVNAKPSRGGNELIDVDSALGFQMETLESRYDERDLALYALGVGAGRNPLDTQDLHLVYERNDQGFWSLPTYGVIPALNAIFKLLAEGKQAPGLNYGLDRVLHGEQYLEVTRPLPPSAQLRHQARIAEIWDKGKHAVVVTHIDTYDLVSGELLAKNDLSTVVRGAGGWGGERGPSSEVNVPPERAADAVITERTSDNQALLYRLSGDWNPLHVDPQFATAFGFEKPILHGLCTFGYVGRAVINAFCGGDPRYFKSIKVRFADSVFPGETIKTEMWKESATRILFRATVTERNKVVISNAAVELFAEIPTTAKAGAPEMAVAPEAAKPSASASAGTFQAIGAHVARNPELLQINSVYQFNLKAPDSQWVLDLREGRVTQGFAAKADCTLQLSESDWMDMVQGKADPNKLFMSGKLKITGNVMASQKLQFLQKLDKAELEAALEAALKSPVAVTPDAQPTAAPVAAAAEQNAPKILTALRNRLAANAALGQELGAVVQFKVKDTGFQFVVDGARGEVRVGGVEKPQTVITATDEDLTALARGEPANRLFQQGRLRVDGDVTPAQRLGVFKQLL